MSVLIPFEESWFFTTSTKNSDAIVSSDGSNLSITLPSPGLSVPAGAVNATFEIESASIWNTSPNISVARNNNIFAYSINGVAQPNIVIADGLYSLSSLNSFLSREFVNRGEDANLITFSGDDSTQKVIATFSADVQADFSVTNSVGGIMGFDSVVVPVSPEPTDGYSEIAAYIASFNAINSFSIRSDLVGHGVPINNSGINLLAVIPITAGSTGRQVIYSPNHPTKVDARELRGKTKQTFNLTVCDQNGDPVPQTETWSVLVVLRYYLLMTDKNVPMMDL